MISQIENIDCMEAMKGFPDNYFDLALVDPPYGIGIGNKKTIGKRGKQYSITNYKQSKWDNAIPDEKYFYELFRVSKNQIIFGGNYFAHFLPPSQGWFVYDKRQPDGFSMAQAELAFTSFDRSIRMKGFARNLTQNCVSNNRKVALLNAKIHQAQKPIALYKWIYKNYLPEGGKVIDTHLGSGSNRIAAHDAGNIDFYGYEIDKEYFEAQEKRFNNHIKQLTFNFEPITNN